MPAHRLTPDEFWARVGRAGPDECWPWLGHCLRSGYGQAKYAGQRWQAHRLAWTLINGPIPEGLLALHSCDVRYPVGDKSYRRCCNLAHLFLGTHDDNMADMVAKQRAATGERNGSRLYPERLLRGETHPLRLHPERAARGDQTGARRHPERRARGERHGSHTHPERVPRGEHAGLAKLTDETVREIRRLYAQGGSSQKGLGLRFGVSGVTIGHIVKRRTWRHVADAD